MLQLDSPCAHLDAAGSFLIAVTARGRIGVWNVVRGRAQFDPLSIVDLIAGAVDLPEDASPPTIASARVRPNGAPVISLTDGRVYSFDPALRSWVQLSSPWWARGSEIWESRRGSAARGVVKFLESSVNEVVVSAGGVDAMDVDGAQPATPDGEVQPPVGVASDWPLAMTLGHLETRMAAALALDSPVEYKAFVLQYAQRIAAEGLRSKADELVRDLLGPVYHRPNAPSPWVSTVLGLQKRDLLREVCTAFGPSSFLWAS